MKKKTYKIIICISLMVILFVSIGNVFGATNPDYKPTVSVTESALDSKIKSSVLLDTLANMINAVASLAESLLGGVFKTLTKENIFPWADRIIFNGIGFLDINFLNPADNSLFVGDGGNPSVLGEVVKQVYSTILSLAILFLGVAVGIMAIRLAISTIAAEKAKYKQAIVNWVTCIVMLFLMHYILAFVFWVNEQMVQIASGILKQTIEDSGLEEVDFSEALNAVVEPEQRVKNFFEAAISTPSVSFTFEGALAFLNSLGANNNVQATATEILNDKDKTEVANRLIMQDSYVKQRLVYVDDNAGKDAWKRFMQQMGNTNRMMADIGVRRLEYDVNDATAVLKMSDDEKKEAIKNGYYSVTNGKLYITEDAYMKDDAQYDQDLKDFAFCIANKENANTLYTFYTQNLGYKLNTGDNPNLWQSNFNSSWKVLSSISTFGLSDALSESQAAELEGNIYKALINDENSKKNFARNRVKVDSWIISGATGVKSSTTDIIANLGQFFKQSAYVYTTEEVETGTGDKKEVVTGWRASKVSVTGALLYAIFLFQSCMYFITYVKRLFFVIMLAMFGPIVVIYDFFMKSVSG